MIRIISGKAKGRKLKAPAGKRIRPLTDRVKTALFNILGDKVINSYFLDLFAGTGSVGIEALSRGAELAIFVEYDRSIVETIRKNLELTGFSDRAEIYALRVSKAIKILASKGAKFDIIFLGAPYGSPELEKGLQKLGEVSLLAENSVVIAEYRSKYELPDQFGMLKKFRDAKYGDTMLSFYRKVSKL